MIGDIIAKIRSSKKVSKTNLAAGIDINIGHLTHIEKGERNPSHKLLKGICDSLEVPYQQLMYTYDINLTDEQKDYNAPDHIIYNSVPVIDGISGFINCPKEMNMATFVLRVFDKSMEPKLTLNSYVYVRMSMPLDNKDFGLFIYNNQMMIRKFIIRKNDIVLRSEKSEIKDIVTNKNDNFFIIGKILGKVNN